MFETVKHQGMTCWADSLRKEGYGSLVFLSIFGNRNAVKAVWASLVGAKKRHHDNVCVGEHFVRRADDATYATIQAPLGEGLLHLVLLHTSATQQASMFEESFFQLGPNAPEHFFPRMTQLCSVPLKSEWREQVWTIGLRAKLIVPLEGFGLTVHRVHTNTKSWAPVIQQAILDGEIY
jgi:hypothetical protein